MRLSLRISCLLLLAALAAAGCNRAAGGPPTVVLDIPSPAVSPTAPFLPPTETLPAERSSTPSPTHTPPPTPTLVPPPTATPPGQLGPESYPANVNPLTGLEVADTALLNRRPLAIKVSNYPDCVRPQSGLSLADLVFQHYAEGPTTRFTAIFYAHDAARVGSVRSARLIDLEIPAMYQSLFAFSGASPGVLEKLEAVDFRDYILSPEFEPGHRAFFRVPLQSLSPGCQVLEHSLFTSTDRLWADADTKGINARPELGGMIFNSLVPAGGQPAATVSLAYSGEYVRWNYSETAGLYYRYSNGAPQVDALTSAAITAANVVVTFAHHETTLILENLSGYNPATGQGGGRSIEIQMWGSGPGLVFRDGQAFSITWLRPERVGPLQLIGDDGLPVPLKPGATWFQLANLNSPVAPGEQASWTIEPLRPTPAP